jgi:hypothetical protein
MTVNVFLCGAAGDPGLGKVSAAAREWARKAVRNLTADGHSAREIADIVGVSHDTAARDVRNLTAVDAVAASPPHPPKPRRQRRPTLARLVAKAKQLGVDVTVEADGAVTFHCSATASDAVINEWDEVLPRHGTH